MAVSLALRRLLRIREVEEEQSQLALESAVGELIRLKNALTATAERDRRGRRLVSSSVLTGELPDRLAGLEETRAAAHHAGALSIRIESAEVAATELQKSFLARRVKRRQAEALIEETEAREVLKAARRSQQALDDGHGARIFRANSDGMSRRRVRGSSPELRSDCREDDSHPS